MPKHSKRFRDLQKKAPREALPLEEAVARLKEYNTTKFDQTVELAIRLGIDPKQPDQIVRGSLVLPHGVGREQRVIVFAKDEKATQAEEAGAMAVGSDELAQRVKDGWVDFDVCIATPDMMPLMGKYQLGKILGPRGLMPNPKAGTITLDVAPLVREYKAGKVEFRNQKDAGNVNVRVGKLSFEVNQLVDNIRHFLDHIQQIKPQAVKGQYFKGAAISATMSPGIILAV